jgi:hypothetical protein
MAASQIRLRSRLNAVQPIAVVIAAHFEVNVVVAERGLGDIDGRRLQLIPPHVNLAMLAFKGRSAGLALPQIIVVPSAYL